MKKDTPLISQLLRAIIVEDYKTAIDIVTSDKFDPNEKNKSWNSPVLSAIITVLTNVKGIQDRTKLKEVLKEITKHKDFDPNIVDAEGETILMHIARHPEFNWLAPFIMCSKKLDLKIKNFMHRTAIDIAEICGNTVLADILIAYKVENHKGLPRKRVGIKKKAAPSVTINSNILDRIENAFTEEAKKNPVSLYNLLVNFFKKNYDNCIQIVRDVNFNPNENDRWGEPALSSLIYYSQDSGVEYDEKEFERIADAMLSIPRFDVNALDADCNTVLMVSMGFPRLTWLTEKLFNISSARLDVKNDCGETLREIADNCGNSEFYSLLLMKSFEMAEVFN